MLFMGEQLNRHGNKRVGTIEDTYQRRIPDGLVWGYSDTVPGEDDDLSPRRGLKQHRAFHKRLAVTCRPFFVVLLDGGLRLVGVSCIWAVCLGAILRKKTLWTYNMSVTIKHLCMRKRIDITHGHFLLCL